jgi:hypothetical protein
MLWEGARTKGISRLDDFYLRHNYNSGAATRRVGARIPPFATLGG